jgi:WD40 repeat protein
MIKIWNISQQFEQKNTIKHQRSASRTSSNKSDSQILSPFLVRTLGGHLAAVLAIKYLGDNQLASGSSDYTVKIWDITTGDVLKTLSGHMNDVLCISS